MSASTGVAIYPDDGDDINALLQQADSEMYRAKRSHPIHRET
ncbi:MAG: diguanylate cyclase [Gammaproteobacteria bacterium]|nr:diguanylate cyclase [Gammaproteobacteria bacterium]